MDTKALAKSKRAHSLHHSKKHNSHQASKSASLSSGDKKPTGKLPKEKPKQSHSARPLPSNLVRYNDDFDLGSGDSPEASPSQPMEFVAPKSKGADYSYLISEAKTQANYASESFGFSDDNISSFTQDFGPILAAKGQNIFSWIADDTSEFESKSDTNLEVPFLSLNLVALAEQFSKAKLSERLFLEPDLLPLELLDDELQEFGDDEHNPRTSKSVPIDSAASLHQHNQGGQKDIQQDQEPPSSITPSHYFPVQVAKEGLNSTKQIKDDLQSESSYKSMNSAAGKQHTFAAVSAEAELDMLLNSFSETKIFETSGAVPVGISSSATSTEPFQKDMHTMKHATEPTHIADPIDNLLKETSNTTKTEGGSKSKLLDDFDSWLDTI